MRNNDKKWYYYKNDQKFGPISITELESKIVHSELTGETQVWCPGMDSWESVRNIEQLKEKLPSGAVQKKGATASRNQDLSVFIELRPNEFDDRTGAIDSAKLRKAKRLAAEVHRHEENAKKQVLELNSKSNSVMIGAIIVLMGAFSLLHLSPLGQKYPTFTAKYWWNRIVSPIPQFEDVGADEYQFLKTTAEADILEKGPQVALALSSESLTRPVFIVTSNLPEGTRLNVSLTSNKATLLSQKDVEIQFPVVLSKHFARTKPIHTLEGTDIPIGEYSITVTEDDEQPADVKKMLDSMPALQNSTESLPGQKKKIRIFQIVFLGGKKDSFYSAELQKIQVNIHNKALNELNEFRIILNQAQSTHLSLNEYYDRHLKAKNKREKRKILSDFLVQVKRPASRNLASAEYFQYLVQKTDSMQKELGELYQLMLALLGGLTGTSQIEVQVTEKKHSLDQKLNDLIQNVNKESELLSAPNSTPEIRSK